MADPRWRSSTGFLPSEAAAILLSDTGAREIRSSASVAVAVDNTPWWRHIDVHGLACKANSLLGGAEPE